MKLPYVPLRVHTAFSVGAIVPSDFHILIEKYGLEAIGVADPGSLHAWGWARSEARRARLKLLYGAEVKVPGGSLLVFVRKAEGMRTLLRALNLGEIGGEGVIRIFVPQRRLQLPILSCREDGPLYIGIDTGNRWTAYDLSRKLGLPLLLVQPIEYEGDLRRYLLVRSLKEGKPYPKLRARAQRLRHNRILSPGELSRFFGELAREITMRTFEVAEMCEFDPADAVPGLPPDLYSTSLRELAIEAARRKFGMPLPPGVRERLFYEIGVIEEMGFAPYFLLVRDLVDYARERGILHNLRGSGASSLVAYLLGISHVNPMEHDLYFERFLNQGRRSPPDIDIDLEAGGREEILSYLFGPGFPLRGKVGMAMVSTFRFYRARSALYDTLRAFGFSPGESSELRERVPFYDDPDALLKADVPEGLAEIYELAASLRGLPREISLHVGGVLFVPTPLEDYLPVQNSSKGVPQCHFDKETVEDFGLIKLDLLSVRGLKLISECMRETGVREFPESDERVYAALSEGDTIGCFQIESPGMMALLRRMKPRNLKELSFALALIRPGPTESGMKELYLAIREGKRKPDELFLRLLPETEGVLLFEEQVMQVAVRTLGVSIEEAERLRREFKKGGSAELRRYFVERASKRGFSRSDAEKIYTLLLKFSSYSFNRAHSVSYAWMAEKAIYFKVHYPQVFFAALLRADGGYYRLSVYAEEARRKGIMVLPPSILTSSADFSLEGDEIRTGLRRIKYLGSAAVKKILSERKKRNFSSLRDFSGRVRLTSREKLSLLDSGALDALEPDRRQQVLSLLGNGESGIDLPPSDRFEEKVRMYESLGFLPGEHPLALLPDRLPLRVAELSRRTGEEVQIDLYLLDARVKRVRRGRLLFLFLGDETGLVQGTAEEGLLRKIRSEFLRVRARVRENQGLVLDVVDIASRRIGTSSGQVEGGEGLNGVPSPIHGGSRW